MDKLQNESVILKEERDQQEKRLIEKKMKCDKVKLEIANAERQLKYDEDSYKKQIVEINSMLVNRDAQSQVVENKKVAQITIKTDTTDTFN